MKTKWWLGLVCFIFSSCQSLIPPPSVDAYIENNPRTLVVVAEAMRRGEVIEDMTPQEVEILLGKPIGSHRHKSRGDRKLVLTYSKSCLFRTSEGVRSLKSPVAVEYVAFDLNKGEMEWRLVNAWVMWR